MSSEAKYDALNQQPIIDVGRIVVTDAACSIPAEDRVRAIAKHSHGDWGLVGNQVWDRNDIAAEEGNDRILSCYESSDGVRFWVCTNKKRTRTAISLQVEHETPPSEDKEQTVRNDKRPKAKQRRIYKPYRVQMLEGRLKYVFAFLCGVFFENLCSYVGEFIRSM